MSYYQFNSQEILQKSKERYFKEKAAEYYSQNKKAIKEKSKNQYKNLSQEEKDKIEEYQKKRYQQLIQYKKEALHFFLLNIRMSERTLKFNKTRLNKKEFHKSKQSIDLKSVNVDQIVVPDKFKHIDEGFKYFIGYQEDEIVKRLCIILPQMGGYIKYFENGGKNMSFMVKDSNVLDKYNNIWEKIKKKLNIKFHSKPVQDKNT